MELWNDFVNLVDGGKTIALVILILVNVMTGIAVAIKTKTFSFAETAGWLKDRILGLVVPYYAVGALALVQPDMGFTVPTAFGFIMAYLTAKILTNLGELGIPVPLPDAIKSRLV